MKIDKDTLEEILITITRNKTRSLLTAFGVFWGIFMLVALSGGGQGMQEELQQQFEGFATNSGFVVSSKTNEAYKGFRKGRWWDLEISDVDLVADVEGVQMATPSTAMWGKSAVYEGNKYSCNIRGLYPEYEQLEHQEMAYGRFINDVDIREGRKVCVIGKRVYESIFKEGGDPCGKYVQVDSVYYQVVGVYEDQNSFSPSALAPFTTIQAVYAKGDSIDNITFTTKGLTSEADNEAFESDYRRMLGGQKLFDPTDDGAIWIWNRFTQYLQQQAATHILHIAIWVIGIFTLLSGIVGVSNIMLITVRERTHEFGIRKALGAKPVSILWLIISESVTITTFFGYVGMVAGIAVTEYMNVVAGKQTMDMGVFSMTFFENPTVDLSIAIEATLTLIIAGTLAGLFPALKAVRIRPIEALRAE